MTRTDRRPRKRLDPDARRAAILEAAASQFATTPYDRVKIAAISEQADASDALIYRYFRSKEGLYESVLEQALEELSRHRDQALSQQPAGSSIRDRIQVVTAVHLEHLAGIPGQIPLHKSGAEPTGATELRAESEAELIELLHSELNPSQQLRHEFALHGYLGFLNSAGAHWASQGCTEDARWALIDAALGALEGALGDWAA
ncbi:TetR/AcrR family transcriptional regulator [Corynebacterium sp. A21]|uniref:TetR/AcrR family transcriptional regulator n=1 Tax=Corynebacterium sp. A21 TaxID=3457318 RepID=UPI003FD09356